MRGGVASSYVRDAFVWSTRRARIWRMRSSAPARETRCGLLHHPTATLTLSTAHVRLFSRSSSRDVCALTCKSPSTKSCSTTAMVHRVLLRGQLASRASNGHVAFIPQCRKLVFEYCDKWPSSANARTFLHNHLEDYARAHPHVEIVVRERNHKQPIVRGFYCAYSFFISTIYYTNLLITACSER